MQTLAFTSSNMLHRHMPIIMSLIHVPYTTSKPARISGFRMTDYIIVTLHLSETKINGVLFFNF